MTKQRSKTKEKISTELDLPDDASVHLNGSNLIAKGPKGEVKKDIKKYNISVKVDSKKIIFESGKATKENKKMLGTLTAQVKNMLKGVMQNHTYILKICSGHFPMNVSTDGNKLSVKNFLGEKVPRVLELKEGATVKVESPLIYVISSNKEIAGQVSADIEQLTRRKVLDKRIFQDGIYIINKDGKELK